MDQQSESTGAHKAVVHDSSLNTWSSHNACLDVQHVFLFLKKSFPLSVCYVNTQIAGNKYQQNYNT